MSTPAVSPLLPEGLEALAAGRWEHARESLQEAVAAAEDTPLEQAQALDGLAEALWWLGRPKEAVAARERAYVLHRRHGDVASATRIAAWLSREYGGPLANASAARGWLARAESLAHECADPGGAGWLALARAERSSDRAQQAHHARDAVDRARQSADHDLEILALARLGLALIGLGDIDGGVARLDEAMAAGTAGEAERLSTVAEVYCQLVVAAELLGDTKPFGEWAQVLGRMSRERELPVLMEFCDCCQAEVSVRSGDVHGAEAHLKRALAALDEGNVRARCVSPARKLADLWITQGRLGEAEHVLAREDPDDVLLSRSRLALALGDHRLARALADRFLRRVQGDDLAAAQALVVVAQSALAARDLESARAAADRLAEQAARSRHPRVQGLASLLRGQIAAAAGRRSDALAGFEEALDTLAAAPVAPEVGHAHLELARLHLDDEPGLALAEARAALAVFESLGAARYADEAAALLRSLGDHSRVGAKGAGTLSLREREVIRLLAEGLSNPEIARRLFISTKTAGNHVSSILTKLGLRSRSEAAAYAVLHLEPADNGETE